MINRLILSEQASFYKRTKSIPKTALEDILTRAGKHKTGNFRYKSVRSDFNLDGTAYPYSLCIFQHESKPTFLDHSGGEIEIKYGYLLVLEIGEYFVISKRGSSSFDSIIEQYAGEVGGRVLANTVVDQSSQYKKISSRSTGVSRAGIKKSTVESRDLRHNLSPLQTTSKIAQSLTVLSGANLATVMLNCGRLNEHSGPIDINSFVAWAKHKVDECETKRIGKMFLDNFAQELDYKSHINGQVPASLFLLNSELLDDVQTNQIVDVEYVINGKARKIKKKNLVSKEGYFQLVKAADNCYVAEYTPGMLDKSLSIIVKKDRIVLESARLASMIITYHDGSTSSLLDFYNSKALFMVSFEDSEVRYFARKLYRDNNLINGISRFLNCFFTSSHLSKTISEKGIPTATCTGFQTNSIFHVVEKHIDKDSDFLVCDDFGNEWADYVAVKRKEFIRFYHAKSGALGLSASAFEIVVSQALKNIGNINLMYDAVRKSKKWNGAYSGSNIMRLRRGKSVGDLFVATTKGLQHPSFVRENVLVVNFLSLRALRDELTKLRKGQKVQNQVPQLLWLISGFINTCLELNVIPKIVCCP